MKNKLIKIACICLMLVSLSVIFTGCGNKGQITIAQIEEVLINAEKPILENAVIVGDIINDTKGSTNHANNCVMWQQNFEYNNIDTTDFMAMSRIYYKVYYNQSEYRYYNIYVFKFAESDDAEECYKILKHLNIVESSDQYGSSYEYAKYKAKQYGNLVVYVYDEIALYTFTLINSIKAK